MGDMMQFPERWEDFLHDYEFEDSKRVYTNGSMLIPSFRVKRMMEHYAPVRHGRWHDVYMSSPSSFVGTCSVCGVSNDIPHPYNAHYCPNCGARMDKEVEKNGKETDRSEGEEPGETDVPGDDRA